MPDSRRCHIMTVAVTAAAALCSFALPVFSLGQGASAVTSNVFSIQLEQGNAFYEAGMLPQAAASYKDLIAALSDGTGAGGQDGADDTIPLLMQTRFNLAQALLAEGDAESAANLFKENAEFRQDPAGTAEELRRRSLFYLALALKKLKIYDEEKRALDAYLSLQAPPALEDRDEAFFELGLASFLTKDYRRAAELFETFEPAKEKNHLRTLSDLYLVRIKLEEGDHPAAAAALKRIATSIKKDNPLQYEVNYLQGEAAFGLHDYAGAINYYKSSLPETRPEKTGWYPDALYRTALSYMKLAEDRNAGPDDLSSRYDMAEASLKESLKAAPKEEGYLALAQCYLSRVAKLKQNKYYNKADELLAQDAFFTSSEGKTLALLLRAEAAPSYAMRDKYYRQLTKADEKNALYVKGWHMRALNDFDQGVVLVNKGDAKEGGLRMADAAAAFRTTFELLRSTKTAQAAEALKLEAVASGYTETPEGLKRAVAVLEELMHEQAASWKLMEEPNEILYLHGYYSGRQAIGPDRDKFLSQAAASLIEASSMQHGRFADLSLRYLAALYYETGSYEEAEKTYLRHADAFPQTPSATESLVWAARCAELLERPPETAKELRRRAFENDSSRSPFAAEAYFNYYSYQDYLLGDRAAIKHLQALASRYPDSPFLIEAHYLIGLDNKRDRKNNDGKWIRKKNPTDAIDSFQKAELLFDDLADKKLIPVEKLSYYAAMRYRATFERAMANLAIANDAQGAKRRIYLDYAEEVFKGLLADLHSRKSPSVQLLLQSDPQSPLKEECTFWLSQTYIKAGRDGDAEQILDGMLANYKMNGAVKGYYPVRALGEKGGIAMRRNDFRTALQLFRSAEDAARGNVLSTDQRLDLLIQQSMCCRQLGQFDDAILILSKVINDDAISSLRVKAMYLRAETYEAQGRSELAKKQLESMVKKGGIWARKAQEKLDKDYVNHGN